MSKTNAVCVILLVGVCLCVCVCPSARGGRDDLRCGEFRGMAGKQLLVATLRQINSGFEDVQYVCQRSKRSAKRI